MQRSLEAEAVSPALYVVESTFGRLADRELLALVARQDVAALEELYDRHIDAVWRVAFALAGEVRAAEIAVEAAFLALWRSPKPDAETSLSTRLLASVTREARAKLS